MTYTRENDHETGSSNSVYISLPNTTNTTDFIDQESNNSMELSKETFNNPAEEVNTEIPGSLQNGTSAQNTTEDGTVTEEKYTEQANEMISNNKQLDSNIVDSSRIENVVARDSSNSSTNAELGMSEDITKINATAGGDITQNEKSESENQSGGTDESSDNSSSNETLDGGQNDPFDSSDSTLPESEKDDRSYINAV